MWSDVYIKPYCRAAPYIVGIFLGYLFHKTKTVRLSPVIFKKIKDQFLIFLLIFDKYLDRCCFWLGPGGCFRINGHFRWLYQPR